MYAVRTIVHTPNKFPPFRFKGERVRLNPPRALKGGGGGYDDSTPSRLSWKWFCGISAGSHFVGTLSLFAGGGGPSWPLLESHVKGLLPPSFGGEGGRLTLGLQRSKDSWDS